MIKLCLRALVNMVGILLDDIYAAIRRTTVNDDVLKVFGSLVDDALDSEFQSFSIIIVDGDDGVSHMTLFFARQPF